VSQKGATKLMAVTSSNLNRVSKFFYQWKESEISNKIYVSLPTTPYICCRTTLGNLKVQICRKSGRKCKQKMPHKPVKFTQLSEKSHEQSLNLPSLLFCRLMKGVQIVKKHKK